MGILDFFAEHVAVSLHVEYHHNFDSKAILDHIFTGLPEHNTGEPLPSAELMLTEGLILCQPIDTSPSLICPYVSCRRHKYAHAERNVEESYSTITTLRLE